MKKVLCVIMSVLMIGSTMIFAGAENETKAADNVTGFTDEDYLVVKGRKMYNQRGEEVQLKGVNIGAWLVREDWLNPDDVTVKKIEDAHGFGRNVKRMITPKGSFAEWHVTDSRRMFKIEIVYDGEAEPWEPDMAKDEKPTLPDFSNGLFF